MNNNRINTSLMSRTCTLAVMLLIISSAASTVLAVQKMKPAEIVAKHLESIGTAEARKAINNRVIVGTSTVAFHNPGKGQATGQAVMASEGNKVLIGMQFDNTNYPYEKLGFDGNNFTASFLTPGVRSTLGDFLHTNSFVFKQGLIGGALSSAWPLLETNLRGAHLEYGGIKKINDREVYQLRYLPRGGSDLQVSLYFDKETFQHVRTEYEQVIAAQLGANPSGAPTQTQRETRYKMIEDFSDYKKEGDLTLPHTYKVTLSLGTRTTTFLADWTLNLVNFSFNQPMDANSFTVGNS
ncbi:MAG TPA: hypothetical protein VGN95_06835 [Pyrinomonadaceae bacterium]|jgi:hypothetical protein|nr:hypothetical protein [Pyrinomonadaceae bacterium]